MLTIEIHDEQLARQLQQIARQENRPVEDVLKDLVARYPGQSLAEDNQPRKHEVVQRVRRKAYAKARQYWQSVGAASKAALSDEELDDQFGAFDEEGIPRLKSELKSLDPPIGSLAYAAKIAREANISTASPVDASRADEILNEEFADILRRRSPRHPGEHQPASRLEGPMRYTVVYEKGENNWSAFSPDVPGCIATGKDRQETEQNFKEALQFHLEGLLEDGDTFPEPVTEVGTVDVRLPQLAGA